MTAVDDYQAGTSDFDRDADHRTLSEIAGPAHFVMRLADAAIAELAVADDRYKAMVKNVAGYEATIEAMRGQYTDLMIENKQLQSFIIHDGVARPYSVKALQEKLQQAEAELAALKGRRCEGCRYWLANGCPQIGGWHPADFSCSEWQPLPETRP